MTSRPSKRTALILPVLMMLLTSGLAFAAEVVYVPMGSDNKILIIDPKVDRVTGEITGVPAIHGLAGTPDGRYLIAGSLQERDPDGGPPEIPEGMSEDEHASHHRAPAADTEQEAPSVSIVTVLNRTDRAVVRRIVVPGPVHHVAAGPDNDFAIVTHPDQDMVSVIDLSTFTLIATVATGSLPNYAVFSDDGASAYVSNAGDNSVSEIDTKTWKVRRSIPTGASPEHVALSPDGRKLYVNNVDDGLVSTIDVEQGAVETTYTVGASLHGIDVSDDGRTLFVASLGSDEFVAIDIASSEMRYVKLSPQPYHLAAIRGTGKVYVSSADDPKIWVIDQETLKVIGEIDIGGKGHQIVLGAGG